MFLLVLSSGLYSTYGYYGPAFLDFCHRYLIAPKIPVLSSELGLGHVGDGVL